MARDVVPLRLSEAEKTAVARGAARLGVTVSEFLRRAALASAFRLSGEQRAKPQPVVVEPEPVPVAEPEPQPAEPHHAATYHSFEAYRVESPYASGGPVFPPAGRCETFD